MTNVDNLESYGAAGRTFESFIQDIRPTEMSLFEVLSHDDTDGTAYDYSLKFPNTFFEEVYYILECATRQNAEPAQIVSMCQDIIEERNAKLIKMVDNESKGVEIECDPSLVEYDININNPNLLKQQSGDKEGKRE